METVTPTIMSLVRNPWTTADTPARIRSATRYASVAVGAAGAEDREFLAAEPAD